MFYTEHDYTRCFEEPKANASTGIPVDVLGGVGMETLPLRLHGDNKIVIKKFLLILIVFGEFVCVFFCYTIKLKKRDKTSFVLQRHLAPKRSVQKPHT